MRKITILLLFQLILYFNVNFWILTNNKEKYSTEGDQSIKKHTILYKCYSSKNVERDIKKKDILFTAAFNSRVNCLRCPAEASVSLSFQFIFLISPLFLS